LSIRASGATFNDIDSINEDNVNDPIQERVQAAVSAALDRKAFDLDVLSVGKITSIADYFILCSGTTERQTQAVADAIEGRLRDMKVRPLLVEGASPGRWILMDYGDFIVHIFTEDCRRFYGLERLWGDAPNVTAKFVAEEKQQAQ
jgi:ribosome-associated protein